MWDRGGGVVDERLGVSFSNPFCYLVSQLQGLTGRFAISSSHSSFRVLHCKSSSLNKHVICHDDHRFSVLSKCCFFDRSLLSMSSSSSKQQTAREL